MFPRSATPLLSALALLAPLARAGQVLVVGPGPQQIAEIQAAVDAALDDDVILVKSGTYQSFVVSNKSLTIVADVGETVNVQGAIRARGLTVDRALVLAGLRATGQLSANPVEGDGLYLKNCAGSVRVQDCALTGWSTPSCGAPVRHGAEIEGCGDVSFVRCSLTGSAGNLPDVYPRLREGHGLVATGSSVSLHETTVRGGSATTFCSGLYAGIDGADGGHGILLYGSELYASNSTIRGADGGNGASTYLSFGGDGGAGLILSDAGCVARVIGAPPQGGYRGTGACGLCGTCCWGSDGAAVSNSGGTYAVLPGTRRALGGPSVARESTTVTLTLQGVHLDFTCLAIRRAAGYAFDPALSGVVLTAGPAPTRYLILGEITTAFTLTAPLALPAVPGSSPGQRWFLQSLHVDTNGQRWIGSPLTLTVLDSAY